MNFDAPRDTADAPFENAGGWRDGIRALREPVVTRLLTPVRRLCGPREDTAFGILMYHRIAPISPGVPRPTWNVTPDRFRAQLAGLKSRGYSAWPLRRALEHARAGEPIPRNVFVVTFDDGYENNFLHAWPILRELAIPATIFLATAYIDWPDPFPSDDWSAAGLHCVPKESWRPLTTVQCTRMHEHGLVELGAHTHTHDDFRGRPRALATDLRRNVRVLFERFGIDEPTFAFPYGTKKLGFAGGALTEAVRDCGVQCALTTEDALVRPGDDPYDWGRFTAHQHDTAGTLAVKLDGWWSFARDVFHGRSKRATATATNPVHSNVSPNLEAVR